MASLILASLLMAAASPGATLDLRPQPDQQKPIFDWSKQRCPNDNIIPDAPARAFRRADGQISLIATHFVNWTLTGPRWSSLRTDCRPVFGPADTGANQHAWIEATYTMDGRTVTALLSRELSIDTDPRNCKPGKGVSCWLSDIVTAQSGDMGRHYRMGKVAATLGDRMPAASPSRYGAFTTSNIARGQSGYYMVVFLDGPGSPKGNCLLRSDNPMNPALWRAWDGQQFTLDLSSPAQARRCHALPHLDAPVRSINWLPRQKRWVAMMAAQRMIDGKATQGFFYAQSADLRNWGLARLLLPAPVFRLEPGRDYMLSYPVLIDPDSRSRNFETLDHDQALLLFVRRRFEGANGTMDRDLLSMPVQIGSR
ncbi:hypothetical protein ACFOKF_04505 [Sphingobium rhizovicinum]|uniref:DUF4185 domain-containing protein n=1 Tax=Sphingobium rhizovicinum TaxID=432308 RepID=A0ABV7NDD6_9SPHN